MTDDPASEGWHLDKRVPVALILTLAMQFGAGVWVASQMSASIRVNERDILRLQAQAQRQSELAQTQALQLARIEETLVGMRGDIGRLISIFEDGRP